MSAKGGLRTFATVEACLRLRLDRPLHNYTRVALARYIVRATGAAGPVEFQQRLTIDQALDKARELRDAHFSHITLRNVINGVEITDLEALVGESESVDPS